MNLNSLLGFLLDHYLIKMMSDPRTPVFPKKNGQYRDLCSSKDDWYKVAMWLHGDDCEAIQKWFYSHGLKVDMKDVVDGVQTRITQCEG